jgi:small subunit ribosomal protein S6
MTILTPDVPEEEIGGAVEQIAGYITTAGGSVSETLRESPWGRRRLAYPIRHSGRDVRDGFYTVYHFEIEPGKIEDVERELRLNDLVIRYLVTHYTPKPVEESVEGEPAEGEASVAEAVESDAADETVGASAEATEDAADGGEEVDEVVDGEVAGNAESTGDDATESTEDATSTDAEQAEDR